MKIRSLAFLMLIMTISGCDRFYGPKIQNAFGRDVTVTVVYSNGETSTSIWPVCRTAFIGKEALQVEKVFISADGRPLREFAPEEIRLLVKQQEGAKGYSVWRIGPEEAKLITNQAGEQCLRSGP